MLYHSDEAMETARPLRISALLAGMVLLHLSLAFHNYGLLMAGPEAMLLDTDPYYQVRRVWLTVRSFPLVHGFDHYLSYPEGNPVHWPAGFTLLLASIARPILGAAPDISPVARVSAIVTTLLSASNVVLAYLAGRRLAGQGAGLASAFLVAFNGFLLGAGAVGRVDHHVLEPLFTVLIFLLFVRSARSAEAGRTRDAAWAGLALALSFFFIPAANAFPALLAGGAIALWGAALMRRSGGGTVLAAACRTNLWGFVFLVPVALTSIEGRAGTFHFEGLSLFQPAEVLLLGLFFGLFGGLAGRLEARGASAARLFGYLFLFALAAAALVAATPLRGPVATALRFAAVSAPQLANTIESQSMARAGIGMYLAHYSYLLLLFPVAGAYALHRMRRDASHGWTALAYLFFATLVLGVTQIRHMSLSVIPFSIVLGAMLDDALAWAGARGRRGLAGAAVFLIIGGLIMPTVARALRPPGDRTTVKFALLFDTLIWLREHTPATSHLDEPGSRPEYGVLAQWEFGHYITYFARRPNISNPFGIRGELKRAALFYSETDEERAYAHARRIGARYIVVTEEEARYPALGLEGTAWDTGGFNSMAARLYYLDGAAGNIEGENILGLGRFRLVYESKRPSETKRDGGAAFAYDVVAETVEGARATGRTKPTTAVWAQVRVVTNTGREFHYRTRAMSDAAGLYEMRLPYATTGGPYETGARGPYVLESAGEMWTLDVDEADVLEGRQLAPFGRKDGMLGANHPAPIRKKTPQGG